MIELKDKSIGYLYSLERKGGEGSGIHGHTTDREEGDKNSFSKPEGKPATNDSAQKLNEEWNKTYPKQPEGPFWDVTGEKNGKYSDLSNFSKEMLTKLWVMVL